MWDSSNQGHRINIELAELIDNEPLELKELLRNLESEEAIENLTYHLDTKLLDRLIVLLARLDLTEFQGFFKKILQTLNQTKEASKIRRDLLRQLIMVPTPMTIQELGDWLRGATDSDGNQYDKRSTQVQIQEENKANIASLIPQDLLGFVNTIEIILERLKKIKPSLNLAEFKLDHVITGILDKEKAITPKSLINETIELLAKHTSNSQREVGRYMKSIVDDALEQEEYRFYPVVDLLELNEEIESPISVKGGENAESEDYSYSELEQLQFFIENGRLVAMEYSLSISQLEELIIKLLGRGSSQIAGILGGAPIKRLIHQFSEEVLVQWAIFQQKQDENKITALIALLKKVFQIHEEKLKTVDEQSFIWVPLLESLAFFRNTPTLRENHLMRVLFEQINKIWNFPLSDLRDWVDVSIPLLESNVQATLILAMQEEDVFSTKENENTTLDKRNIGEIGFMQRLSQFHKLLIESASSETEELSLEFSELFKGLLEEEPKELIHELKSIFKEGEEQILRNFITSTPKEHLYFLLAEWIPAQTGFVRSLTSVLQSLYERHPTIFSEVENPKMIHWMPILSFLLREEEDKFQVNHFLETTIAYIEKEFQIPRPEVLELIREVISEKRTDHGLVALGDLIESEIKDLPEQQSSIIPKAKKEEFSFDINSFIRLLKKDGLSVEWEIAESKMAQAIRQNPNQMRILMWNMISEGENRIQLINKLSDDNFWLIVNLLQPNQADEIRKWVSDLEQLLHKKVIKEHLLNNLYDLNLASFDLLDFTEQLYRFFTKKQDQYIKLLESSIRFLEVANTPTKTQWIKIFKELLRPELETKRSVPKAPQAMPKETLDEKVYISNAGIVILWPFFTRYFQMAGLTEARKFIDEQAAERAAHLLQYLANGNMETPEHEMVLNKILCGIPLYHPISASIDMTESEIEMSKKVLLSAVGNWEKMKNLPIGNLRGSFLLREGRLEEQFESWQLVVEPKPFDILLDSLPWTISTIKLPWMPKALNVEWR